MAKKGYIKADDTGGQFDRVAVGYDFMESLFHNNDFFLSWMPRNRNRALDIGCGSGIMASALAGSFVEVVGVDISQAMLDIAKRLRNLPNIRYLKLDAVELPEGEKYDYIVSRTTFHHIDDIPSLLRRLQKMLNPEGRIVILDCAWKENVRHQAWYRVFPFMEALKNAFRIGLSATWKVFRFRLSKPWLDHLASDRYMTADEFREVYSCALPGCQIGWHECFMYVVWDNPS
ncbi:MAG TPA: class I SAM-dependent methyltransferase [bacterium]|nr:class I SAM-dependent methyltransferase [bacterium]